MNPETLARFLEILARWSGQAAVLVLVILVAQRLFRRWLSPGWRSALWLVVVARLLVPVSVPSRLSVFNFLPGAERKRLPQSPVALQDSAIKPSAWPEVVTDLRSEPGPEIQAVMMPPVLVVDPPDPVALPPIQPQRLAWPVVLFAIWLAGALALASQVLATAVSAARRLRRLPEVSAPELLGVLDECRAQMRVRTRLKLVEAADLRSPALHGILRPRLLLPAGFTQSFTPSELRFVFLHELAHVKRQDVLVSWLMALAQIVHWFNPLLWFGFKRWRADRELACDALALQAAGEGRNKEYGRTILRLLEGFTHRVRMPGLVGILEDKRQLQQRIALIAAFVPARRRSAPAVALLLGLSLIGLTDARTATSSRLSKAVSAKHIDQEIRNSLGGRVELGRTPLDQRLTDEKHRNETRERVGQGFVQAAPAVSEALPSIHNPRLSEAVVEDQINKEIRNNFSNRSALMNTLQEQGLTYQEYRNKARARVEQRLALAAPAVAAALPSIHNPRPSPEASLLQFRLVAEEGETGPVDELTDPTNQDEAAQKLQVLRQTLLDESA
ncbi:MAG: M56 family metallopeptidase, partial [Verrucomicrobiales bacterium]|nr:M56 family metallopeptidase [Verrucomicrobiales bacterium]